MNDIRCASTHNRRTPPATRLSELTQKWQLANNSLRVNMASFTLEKQKLDLHNLTIQCICTHHNVTGIPLPIYTCKTNKGDYFTRTKRRDFCYLVALGYWKNNTLGTWRPPCAHGSFLLTKWMINLFYVYKCLDIFIFLKFKRNLI